MKLEGVQAVPEADLLVAPALARWSKNRPYAGDARKPGQIGASGSGGCSRTIHYRLAQTPRSNPMQESGYNSTGIGSLVHDAIQEELTARPPEGYKVGIEVPWSLSIDVPGHDGETVEMKSFADIVLDDGPGEVTDIKTMSTFAFLSKVKREGPARGDLLQVGLAIKALDLQYGRLVYITQSELKGRDRIATEPGEFDYRENRYAEFVFEWSAVADLVEAELRRVGKVRAYQLEGRDVPRTIPGVTPRGATIVGYSERDRKGQWQLWNRDERTGEDVIVDEGATWHCGWCDWRDTCMAELKTTGEAR